MQENQKKEPKVEKGFASMSAERQREIASLGGKAAHKQGVAHQWNRQKAAEAGRKGGLASVKKKRVDNDGSETLP